MPESTELTWVQVPFETKLQALVYGILPELGSYLLWKKVPESDARSLLVEIGRRKMKEWGFFYFSSLCRPASVYLTFVCTVLTHKELRKAKIPSCEKRPYSRWYENTQTTPRSSSRIITLMAVAANDRSSRNIRYFSADAYMKR